MIDVEKLETKVGDLEYDILELQEQIKQLTKKQKSLEDDLRRQRSIKK